MNLMRHVRTPLLVLAAAALAACDEGATGPTRSVRAPGELAPLLAAGGQAVPGRYIVVMNDGEAGAAGIAPTDVVAQHGGRVHHTYSRALNGFAASLSPEAVDALRRNPRVRYVAHDQMASLDSIQTGATWGLDRIDQRGLPLNGVYAHGTRTGQGVRVYVIDSGIRTSHPEFEGRASVGADFVGDGLNGQDCRGHGTHVAGTIASKRYGVAKGASVVSVRAFGCSGTVPVSTIIAAVEWVTANAQKPAVVNLSLGSAADSALNQAVRASIASGLVYAVAAGNEGVNACTRSPASVPEAITVGATTSNDQRLNFSNWGSCLDVFAPGASIVSTWYNTDNSYGVTSGTSMAAAHVSGVAALHLQGNPSATPAQVAALITSTATARRMMDPAGAPNRLLFSGLTPEGPGNGIVLNPYSLSFTFLRRYVDAQGAAPATGMREDAAPQAFVASSDGGPRAAAAGAGPAGASAAATATSLVLTGRFLLRNAATTTLDWEATTDQPWLTVQASDGSLASEAMTSLNATADAGSLQAGMYASRVTVTDPSGVNAPAQLDVMVKVVEPITLWLGEPRGWLSGGYGTETYFAVTVPAGTPMLTLAMSGGTGEADMFVRYGDAPTRSLYDCANNATGNAETCTVLNPSPGTYYVMVYGWNAYADVTLSASAGGPPSAPANAAARPYSNTSVRLTWDDVLNETGYTVSRRTETAPGTWAWAEAGTLPANYARFTQTVPAGVTYQYRVRSCNASGCSGWAVAAPVALPTAVPSAPFGAVAVATGPTRVGLSWTDGSTDEASFLITRSLYDPAGGTWGPYEAPDATPANTPQFTVNALLAGRTYRFQVSACNVVGCSAPTTSGAVALPTLPAAPTGLTGTVLSGTSVRLNWTDASSNETSFQVSRAVVASTGAVGAYTEVAALAPNQVQFTITGLTAGGTYRFRVRACNVAGCATPATTGNITVAPIPAAPTGFAATATSPTQIRVTWMDVSGETSYSLTRALRNADGTWGATVTLGTYAADTTLVDDSGLAPASTYRYQLRACNLSGCSTKITVAGVTPAS
jgi:subtilisin family serine protease